MKEVIKLFLRLVKIDSPSGDEQGMISFIQTWLKKKKIIYKTDLLGNILAKINGYGDPLLFCVHMDTVEPGKGIKPIINNGFIKSSGKTILGADNKAAITCLLTAVETYLKSTIRPRAFELLFTVKEETGGGVEFFPFHWIKSTKGLTFDSANPLGGIVLRSPHIINFYAEFIGKAAHSSTPEKGKNALLPAIEALNKIPTGIIDNEKTTINIGKIEGGSGINIIPEKIKIHGEIRSYQKNILDKNLHIIENIFKNEAKKYKVKLDFTKDGYCQGYSNNKSDPFIKKIKKNYFQLGINAKFYYHSGISDANILNSKAIKTINLSDGIIDPHTINEHVNVKDLEELTKIILSFLQHL